MKKEGQKGLTGLRGQKPLKKFGWKWQKQEKPRADYKFAQKCREITILYDAWTISTHDTCSNAVRISSIAL